MRLFFIFFISGIFPRQNCAFINILIVIIGDDLSTGFHATVPMIDVALDNARKQYPVIFDQMNKVIVWKSNATFCDESGESGNVIASELYDIAYKLSGFSVFVTSGCISEVSIIGDLARELNMPLLASSAVYAPSSETERHSTTISFSPSGQESLRLAIVELLSLHSWKSVSVICDSLSQNPVSARLVAIACQNLRNDFQYAPEFRMNFVKIDSGRSKDFDSYLLAAKKHGSAVILLTSSPTLRDIMIAAYRLNMTNGNSIFIHPKANPIPGSKELISRANDGNDDIAMEAYKALLVLSFVVPPWENIRGFMEDAKRVADRAYNGSKSTDMKNVYTVSALELMTAFSEVLNETAEEKGSLDTETFISKFRNRTFDMETGSFRIGSNGLRIVDTTISRLEPVFQTFKPTWRFYFENRTMLTLDDQLADLWPGNNGPPIDGVRLDEQEIQKATESTLIGAIVGGIVGAILAIAAIFTCRKMTKGRGNYSTWWRLEPWRVHEHGTKEKSAYGIELARYDDDIVWLQRSKLDVSMDTISSNKTARRTLAEIRGTHHENIGKLYGIAIHDGRMELLWQHDRGSLRTVLDDEKFPLDIGLKVSLIFEILTGLQVIHNSALRFHGMLSSLNTMIDMHYSIKLCAAGSTRIFSALTQDRTANGATSTDLWFAPEMLSDNSHPGSKEADIYAAAIVFSEIVTSGSAIVFDLKNSSSIIRTLSSLTSAVLSPASTEFAEVPSEIRNLISQSFSFDTHQRPRLTNVISVMNKYFKRESVMDRMLQRFQQYSEDLEVTVRARTHELEAEGHKVNALLEEMIPPSLVGRLRNKEIIPAEGFECVTIFFSSLIDFGDFCSRSTPLLIVELLNRVYITFDTILQDFDVYKVETIKDGYMVASGVPLRNDNRHAYEICSMALEFLKTSFTGTFLRTHIGRLQIRIGVHSGTVAAGVVGLLMPRYCLFGDTVNTASRMESHGQASRIHISPDTYNLIQFHKEFNTVSRGYIPIKGKGDVETFWLS